MARDPEEFAPWLGVFETLRVVTGKPLFLVEHRDELRRAMKALGLTSDTDFVAEAASLPMKSGRWRWIVRKGLTRTTFTEEPPPSVEPVRMIVSDVRVGSHNWDARFKTVSYLSHAQAWQAADGADAVVLNELGNVASASRGNIFWLREGRLFTPAHEAGCRCGVVRGFVLGQIKVKEGHYPLADLLGADEIFVTNSMKGIGSINAIADRELGVFPAAVALRALYEAAIATYLQNRVGGEGRDIPL